MRAIANWLKVTPAGGRRQCESMRRRSGRDRSWWRFSADLGPKWPHSSARTGPAADKTGRISLLLAGIRLYTAPSHTEAWLSKAVRWRPGHKARLLTRFRRNQPENDHYGATRFFYASAARSWRSLWPPIAPLESQDGGFHLRCPQQHPHHRPRADRAVAAHRVEGGQRYRRQGRPYPVRRHQAAGAGWRRRSCQAFGAVFRQL